MRYDRRRGEYTVDLSRCKKMTMNDVIGEINGDNDGNDDIVGPNQR